MLDLDMIINDEKHVDILILNFYKTSELQLIDMIILFIESCYTCDVKIIN